MSDNSLNIVEFTVKLASADFCSEFLTPSITLPGSEGVFTILPNHCDYATSLKNSSFSLFATKEVKASEKKKKKKSKLQDNFVGQKTYKFFVFNGLAVFKDNVLLISGDRLFELTESTTLDLDNKIKNLKTQLDICINEDIKLYLAQSINEYELVLNHLTNDKS